MVAGDGLVLAEGGQEVGESLFRDVEFADGPGQGYEHGMARAAVVAGIEVGFPFVEEEKRGLGVAGFVSEVVGDAAVGVNVVKMLAQALGKEPSGDGEIFVMGAGEALAVFVGV